MPRRLDCHTLIQFINRISTDIDILSQKLVRNLVFLQDIVVGACACESRSEEEAEDSGERKPLAKVLTVQVLQRTGCLPSSERANRLPYWCCDDGVEEA
jgi:hypothetical protein